MVDNVAESIWPEMERKDGGQRRWSVVERGPSVQSGAVRAQQRRGRAFNLT